MPYHHGQEPARVFPVAIGRKRPTSEVGQLRLSPTPFQQGICSMVIAALPP